jgi:hypothetical protein
MATITTDLMYRALPYIYRGASMKEFLADNSVSEELFDDFESFWINVRYEVEHSGGDSKTQWDVPFEWAGGA